MEARWGKINQILREGVYKKENVERSKLGEKWNHTKNITFKWYGHKENVASKRKWMKRSMTFKQVTHLPSVEVKEGKAKTIRGSKRKFCFVIFYNCEFNRRYQSSCFSWLNVVVSQHWNELLFLVIFCKKNYKTTPKRGEVCRIFWRSWQTPKVHRKWMLRLSRHLLVSNVCYRILAMAFL